MQLLANLEDFFLPWSFQRWNTRPVSVAENVYRLSMCCCALTVLWPELVNTLSYRTVHFLIYKGHLILHGTHPAKTELYAGSNNVSHSELSLSSLVYGSYL
jgi:hypothetical protein